ncbi:MAG TPA: HD-GYP domain-containing protein [Patescibacteria group bacterium]|nr:HD-GYP domain-containing protein [Patescibacteria group bacterium]
MNVRDISISECRHGDLLAADIFDNNGVVLAVKEVFLNEYMIGHLKGFGVSKVRIFSKFKNETKQFIRYNYIKSVDLLKTAVNNLASGKGLDYDDISATSELIYLGINEKDTIIQCLNEIRYDDDYTYTHSINTAFYAMLISKWMGLSMHETKLAIEAGLLHDVGKVKIPKEVLNKKGKLTHEEYELVKKHTVFGFDLIKDVADIKPEVKQAALLHHERVNRSGYPLQVSPKEINLYSKIISVADVYDAMTSERIYKKRATPFEAFEMFKTIGVSLFDLGVLNVFLKNLPNCYLGSRVLLRNNMIGEVVYIPPQDILNPIIQVEDKYVEMLSSKDYEVVEVL